MKFTFGFFAGLLAGILALIGAIGSFIGGLLLGWKAFGASETPVIENGEEEE
jgi:hypothetical protein